MGKRTWLVLALGCGALWWWRGGAPEDDGRTLLQNRLWIERQPRNERDLVLHVLPLVVHGEQVGVAAVASQYRMLLEHFAWSLDGERVKFEFPQDRKALTARWRAWKCKGEAPDGFELCLEFRLLKSAVRLYSREDWVVDPGARAPLKRVPLQVVLPTTWPRLGDPDAVVGAPAVLSPWLGAD